jgi:hypothetical protein
VKEKYMPPRYAILTPVLDDWPSLCRLITEIQEKYSSEDVLFEIVAVDDGSPDPLDVTTLPNVPETSCIVRISVIQVALNLGHQRAIAVGLSTLWDHPTFDGVIVMDSDGEDRPADIGLLIGRAREHADHVITARRSKRSESTMFKLGYLAYRTLFRVLTGRSISYGNFCLLPRRAVSRLVHMPELWNNLPAAIMRSRLRSRSVATERGHRYFGQSKMNTPSLVVHGLSAMSVYTDVIFVRVLLAASLVGALSVLAIVAVAIIRVATELAIPGWATTVVGDLLIILSQALILMVATTLMLLANRSTRQLVPVTDTAAFIADRRTVMCHTPVVVSSPVS